MRNNEVPAIPGPPLALDWEQDLTAGFGEGAPLLVDSVLFVGNLRGELYAFNGGTGKRFGWVTLGGAIHGAPVLAGNTAIVPLVGSRESLVAYDFIEGRILWRQELGDIHVSPLLLDSRIFVANTTGSVHCVSVDDGTPVWKFELPDNKALKGIRSSPAGFEHSVFFGADDGFLYHLDATTGSQRWRFDTGDPIQAAPVIHDGRVFVGTLAGKLFSIEASTGVQKWSCDVGGSIYGTALVDSSLVIVGTTAGFVVGLHRMTGEVKWKTDLRAPVNSGILGAGEYVYTGTLRKDLLALRRTTGEIVWRGTTGGRVKTTPIAGLGRLFVAGDNRVVQAFKEEKR
jgi:outer membrane protein assembly factor BamB